MTVLKIYDFQCSGGKLRDHFKLASMLCLCCHVMFINMLLLLFQFFRIRRLPISIRSIRAQSMLLNIHRADFILLRVVSEL